MNYLKNLDTLCLNVCFLADLGSSEELNFAGLIVRRAFIPSACWEL